MTRYWNSIDNAFEYNDNLWMKHGTPKIKPQIETSKRTWVTKRDSYHWQKRNFKSESSPRYKEDFRFKLPHPDKKF